MLTDGEVHDVPAKRDALPAAAPLHVLLSGHDGERDRRIVIDSAPRFGIVGENQTIRFRVLDDGVAEAAPRVRVTVTRDGNPLSVELVTPASPVGADRRHRPCRPEHPRVRGRSRSPAS